MRGLTRHLIDEIAEQPPWLHAAGAPRFDVLIDTRGRWKTTLAARRIPHGLFLAPAARYLFSGRRPGPFTPRPAHLVDRLLQLVTLAFGPVQATPAALPIPPESLAAAHRLLPPGASYAGLAPGAGNAVKIWPLDRFQQLALHLSRTGHTPVFLLGPAESHWRDAIAGAVPQALFPLQDGAWQTSQPALVHTLAVATRLDLAIANDSGTGHMLAAVDCPLVSLFGPTLPAKLAPRVSRGRVVDARAHGGTGMALIPVADVIRAVESLTPS